MAEVNPSHIRTEGLAVTALETEGFAKSTESIREWDGVNGLLLAGSITSAAFLGSQLISTHLISSPYDNIENQLQLSDLDQPDRLFAFALTNLKPSREDYATAPYMDSFNWSEVFSLLRLLCKQTQFEWPETEYYVVIFRSKLQDGVDRDRLGMLDQKSHEEACASGGLLKYWFGSPDVERRNLATCLWRNHEDAVAGGAGPWHKQARQAARTMYEKIDFFTNKLIVEAGAKAWHLEEHR